MAALPRPPRHRWLIILLFVVAIYGLLPQIGSFRDSLQQLPHARVSELVIALLATALTYAAAAGTYCLLAVRPLSYARTLLVQPACTFINRLLPAGVGGIGANYVYLRKNHHTQAQAGSVVAANNLIGFIGHFVLLAVLLALFHRQLPPLHLSGGQGWLSKVLIVLVVLAFVVASRWSRRLARAGRGIVHELLAYRHQLHRLGGALLTSIALTLANVISFWYCVQSLHGSLSLTVVLLVFTLGVALGTAIPTPGGLGAVEAGLVAGLVAYHFTAAHALAIVLLYRLISFWLAIAVGGGVFVLVRKRKYL
jgi:undecaprenyl-diphosphatase